MKIESKVLYNVLKNIGTGKEHNIAPDKEYLKSLENIGLIEIGWDNKITELGKIILETLKEKIEKW